MSVSPELSTILSRRYAGALIDLATEKKALSAIEKDMGSLAALMKDSEDFRSFVYSPLFSREQQIGALAEISKKAKFHELTANFLQLLAKNRRVDQLQDILRAVRNEFSQRRGEIRAQVQTAKALSAAQSKELQKALTDALGSEVSLQTLVNPEILGGMVLTVGSQMIDDSVKRKLERLKAAMNNNANQNTQNIMKEVG